MPRGKALTWAAQKTGEPGASLKDIDVLVVGDPPRGALFGIAAGAEPRVRREVNIYRMTPRAWASPDAHPVVKTLRSQPLIELRIKAADERSRTLRMDEPVLCHILARRGLAGHGWCIYRGGPCAKTCAMRSCNGLG